MVREPSYQRKRLKRSTRTTFFSDRLPIHPPRNGKIHFDFYLIAGFSSVSPKRIIPVGLFVSSRRQRERTRLLANATRKTQRGLEGERERERERDGRSIPKGASSGKLDSAFFKSRPQPENTAVGALSRERVPVGNVFSSLRERLVLSNQIRPFLPVESLAGEETFSSPGSSEYRDKTTCS